MHVYTDRLRIAWDLDRNSVETRTNKKKTYFGGGLLAPFNCACVSTTKFHQFIYHAGCLCDILFDPILFKYFGLEIEQNEENKEKFPIERYYY